MGKRIHKAGSKTCGQDTAPLSQYCDAHQPDSDHELTLRDDTPFRRDDDENEDDGEDDASHSGSDD